MFASAVFAQSIIGAPPDGTQVKPGQKVKIMVISPYSVEGSVEVGLVISFLSCATFPNSLCLTPQQQLGSILYNGPYKPGSPNPNPYHLEPHQNFTVQIPPGTNTGNGQLAVTDFVLVGAGPSPTYQIQNITLNVV